MGTAYTPGLKVTPRTTIRKTRRLPLKGEVTVKAGDQLTPETIVAQTQLPGIMQTVRVAEQLSIEPQDLDRYIKVMVGDKVERGCIIAQSTSLFGLLKNEVKSPIDGTVELISATTGHVGVRFKPTPIEVTAYIQGKATEVIPEEGVVVETTGALVQGIFGVGGEKLGEIKVIVSSPDEVTDEDKITEDLTGKVVIAGANITGAALRKAASYNIAGVVVGGIIDKDLIEYLGHDIGVAITGQEKVPTTLIVTEGFGIIGMAHRTFDLLKSLEGKRASINGATQIRAGVIRPEIIVPSSTGIDSAADEEQALEVGTRIRIIREPYFGLLGKVTALPSEPVVIESGAKVRILDAQLENGEKVSVPRANVEIIHE